jgi:hypothetical protein
MTTRIICPICNETVNTDHWNVLKLPNGKYIHGGCADVLVASRNLQTAQQQKRYHKQALTPFVPLGAAHCFRCQRGEPELCCDETGFYCKCLMCGYWTAIKPTQDAALVAWEKGEERLSLL